jgi:hypothetical protein
MKKSPNPHFLILSLHDLGEQPLGLVLSLDKRSEGVKLVLVVLVPKALKTNAHAHGGIPHTAGPHSLANGMNEKIWDFLILFVKL